MYWKDLDFVYSTFVGNLKSESGPKGILKKPLFLLIGKNSDVFRLVCRRSVDSPWPEVTRSRTIVACATLVLNPGFVGGSSVQVATGHKPER